MQNKDDFTLRKLKTINGFRELYIKLTSGEMTENEDFDAILSVGSVCINCKKRELKLLGYKILLEYGKLTNDWTPVYEYAMNEGLAPIAKIIKSDTDNVFTLLNEASLELFKAEDGTYRTLSQTELKSFNDRNKDRSTVIVAPTSYGKTELIVDMIRNKPNANVCIITPTKALLAQTKSRLRKDFGNSLRIVAHPEQVKSSNDKVVAVFTQERLLQLYKKFPDLSFDMIIVDEAHELLSDGSREHTLGEVIIISQKRNRKLIIKYLTPFLLNPDSLQNSYYKTENVSFSTQEEIKSEKYYIFNCQDFSKSLFDKYYGETINNNLFNNLSEFDYISQNSSDKNLVFLNKPKNIETAAISLAKKDKTTTISEAIAKACKNISEFISSEYEIIDCLKSGVIYYHGPMVDSVRQYLEKLYKTEPSIRYLVTNSALLQGVNLSVDRLFVLDWRRGLGNLTPSDFRNLVGRICRFGDIFRGNGDLLKLIPEIHIIKGNYAPKRGNPQTFLTKSVYVGRKIDDNVENVLLEMTADIDADELNGIENFLQNFENNCLPVTNTKPTKSLKTQVGRSCNMNGVTEFDIFTNEVEIQKKINQMINENVDLLDANVIIETIYDLFLRYVENDENKYANLNRFDNEKTRLFYGMILNWKINGYSYAQSISQFVSYWKSIESNPTRKLVFVGRWGDTKRGGHRELWTDISLKNHHEKVNLAIVRLKEEQDFLDNTIIKFIEVLNEFRIINSEIYNKIKYGTSDSRMITLVKDGISVTLAKILLSSEYDSFVTVDDTNDNILIKEETIQQLSTNNVNEVIITELELYLNLDTGKVDNEERAIL